jgi:5-methylthioadenosine/S-adenosylhomocysteine deaminase
MELPMPQRDTNAAPQRCSLLVRGGWVIADANTEAIEDGAVCIAGDRIVAVGKYADLHQRFLPEREIGSSRHALLPGLINAHDHGRGPTSLQTGIPDDALEVWILDLLRLPGIDPYLVTALACAEQLEAGVTTVAHSFYEGAAGQYENSLATTVRAYDATGMRAALVLSMLDQSNVATLLRAVQAGMPGDLQTWTQNFLAQRNPVGIDEYLQVLRSWHESRRGARVRMMMGPVSVHWCSEELLLQLWREAEALDIPLQTHLLESPRQRRDAQQRYGKSAVQYLAGLGLLSSRLSCAHCVQVDDHDLELLAAARTSIVHNPSSNLRLCNGIAPLPAMLRHGVNVALGLDSQTLNDDGDMLQEMRLAALLHRSADSTGVHPTARQVLAMATQNGARALGMDQEIGSLTVGKKADLIAIDLERLEQPYIDPQLDIVERLLFRAKARDVDTAIVDGKVVLLNGRHQLLDKQDLLRELARVLEREIDSGRKEFLDTVARVKAFARARLI